MMLLSKLTIALTNHKFRLRTTVVVPFVLEIIGAVGLVGYLSYRNGQQAVNDLANTRNTNLLDNKGY